MKRITFLTLVVASASAAAVAGILSGSGGASGTATGRVAGLTAAANVGALNSTDTLVPVVPSSLSTLPSDVRPDLGSVHRLGFGTLAWRTGGRVCHQDTLGGGGCFDRFPTTGAIMIVDPDLLGEGEPLKVTGIVSDSVTSLTIVARGAEYPARIVDNSVFVDLPDATIKPWEIEGWLATFADGHTEFAAHDTEPLK